MNRMLSPKLIFLCLLALLLAGCGGRGVNFATWAGNYAGSGQLDNHKTGDIALTSDNNGIVTGTLTVTGADGTDTNFKFTAGVYNLTGSITSTSGGFEVNGNVPNNGNFFIRGSFPTDSSNRNYTVVTGTSTQFPNSQSYTGTLARS